jgi:uncharacterized membrane-anchored protein
MLPKINPRAAKVPEIGALFWVIKILTTGIGESTSDFLGQTFIPLAAVVGVFGFWYALRRQFALTEYHPPTYWGCVLMVAVFGTMAADGIHESGLSYAITTPFWAAVVAAMFWRWHRAEGTLSIHSITTREREKHYWCTVFATFALGTAAGDLTAIQLGWGFLPSGFLFLGLNPTLAFWAAYVVTRPLGASFADWLGKPQGQTGLGLGDGPVSAAGLLAFVGLVALVSVRQTDLQRSAHHPHLRREPLPAEA